MLMMSEIKVKTGKSIGIHCSLTWNINPELPGSPYFVSNSLGTCRHFNFQNFDMSTATPNNLFPLLSYESKQAQNIL